MVILIGIGATVCTFLGGLVALRFRDKLHLILGFSAGAVIGVAFFDLLPEAVGLTGGKYDVPLVTSLVALGFVLYMLLDRTIVSRCHEADDGEECENETHRGRLGASSLSIHSFLDGLAIGLSFQVSAAVGAIVAIAVLVHDFSDGINTVALITKSGGDRQKALRWLAVDALAPLLGVIATLFFSLKDTTLGLLLALFCGFFLYIGASDLLPESHHRHPTYFTTLTTLLGVAVLFAAVRLAGM